jgi:hypothetical protein
MHTHGLDETHQMSTHGAPVNLRFATASIAFTKNGLDFFFSRSRERGFIHAFTQRELQARSFPAPEATVGNGTLDH